MSAENVIKKIEEKAAAEAEQIRVQGRSSAAKAANNISAEAREKAADILAKAKKNAENLLRGMKQQEELAVKIEEINEKRRLLGGLRETAEKELAGLNGGEWLKLYTRLVCENAMGAAVYVQVPSKDAGKYSGVDFCRENLGKDISLLDYWSAEASERRGEKVLLLLDKNFAEISGGVILCGENYDIDLSFEAVLSEVFGANEKKIADCLFDTGAV